MNREIVSYPKGKIKILLLENIHPFGAEIFEKAGYTNLECVERALSENELKQALQDVRILGIRSKTNISSDILNEFGTNLLGIGCFCIGTNQVQLAEANRLGVAVFNAPYSNTRSVAELVICLSIMLFRQIIDKNKASHAGEWLKSSADSYEIRGKKLGIVGYGNIGSQVSVMAESMGMDVYYYDSVPKLPLGNATPVNSLDELAGIIDIMTVHIPSNPNTKNMFNQSVFRKMKKGSFFINYARGDVLHIDDLAYALQQKHLAGAAIDVFPEEPENNTQTFTSPLQGLSNVILTPHIGGSTQEAQKNIAIDVATNLVAYLEIGSTSGSKSLPEIDITRMADFHRILHIHKNVPGMISKIANIFFENNINILSQSLQSTQDVGYAVFDVDKNLSREAYRLLKEVPDTIKTRLLY